MDIAEVRARQALGDQKSTQEQKQIGANAAEEQ
jgi:hypothetical protein